MSSSEEIPMHSEESEKTSPRTNAMPHEIDDPNDAFNTWYRKKIVGLDTKVYSHPYIERATDLFSASKFCAAESPRQKRRGGIQGKRHDPMLQICLGMETAPEGLLRLLKEGFESRNSDFFRLIADLIDESRSISVFASHVKEAQIQAAIVFSKIRQPTKRELKKLIIKTLGNCAYAELEGSRWSEVWNAAGLNDLPNR